MTAPKRALLGFAAAVVSLLTFHQGTWALLHAAGLMPPAPYPTDPVPPFGVPRIVNFCFWAGLYGLAFGLGLLATLVLWFVVAPLKGQSVAGGFVPARMLVTVLIHGVWGIGVGLLLSLLMGRRSAARA